jgi:hypothetical protein
MGNNCTSTAPYWSEDSNIYHTCSNCSTGDNIQSDKKKSGYGYGNRTECDRCKKIKAGELTR